MKAVLDRYILNEKAIIHFQNNADDSEKVPKLRAGARTYSSYKLSATQWAQAKLIREVLEVINF